MRAVIGIAAAVGLIGATALITVGVEHRIHAHSDEHASGGEHAEHASEHPDEREGARGRVQLSEEARANAKLELATAGSGKVWVTATLPGEVALNADRVAHISPPVSGTVREVKADLGQRVKKGDLLLVMESRELAELSREARATSQRVQRAEADLKRVEGLVADGVVADKERLAAKSELEQARIARDAAGQMLASAGTSGGATLSLRAPIDGVVIEKHAALGEVLKDDSRVFVVADLSTVWVDLAVYAKDLARVDVGQRVRVFSDGIDAPAEGTIAFLGATASVADRTANARVVLTDPGPRWRPGLFVTAEVAVAEEDAALVVEDDAVQTVEGQPSVFVLEGDAFEARAVKLGKAGVREDGVRVVAVLSGLEPGARYVRKNAFVLKAELGKGEAEHEH